MALPGDLTTFTLNFGSYVDAEGVVIIGAAKGKLFPVDPATGERIRLTHLTSGQVILPHDVAIQIAGETGTATVGPLPHTDNAGLSMVGFGYRVEWDIASSKPSPGNKTFAVPAAKGATANFDLLEVSDTPGVLIPVVTGATGPAGTITSATASGLAAGATPTVTLGGTPSARTIALGIPAGATGPAGTITSASASALAPGATPTVTLGGTASARTMAFGIPGAAADDASMAAVVSTPTSSTAAALRSVLLPKWQANTAYAAGALVLSPLGTIVQAVSAFTSGASYNAANWTTISVTTSDPRLTDTRTPTDGSVTVAGLSDATLSFLRDPHALAVGESTVPRTTAVASVGPASGTLRLTYFTAAKSEAVTQIRVPVTTAVSGTTPTLIRFGIWSENPSTGDLTLVASTANDTTLLASTATPSTKPLQATWNKVKGQRYAWAPLIVTTGTMPAFAGANVLLAASAESSVGPRVASQMPGQTDLLASITGASLGNSGLMFYAALLP